MQELAGGREKKMLGLLQNKKIKIGLVVAQFNSEITSVMQRAAEQHAREKSVQVISVIKVPGAYDIPIAVQRLLRQKDIHAVIALGAIIKGETDHDAVIAHSTAKTLQELSLQYNKPVTLGIAGPGMTWKQADARKEEYGRRAVDAAIALVGVLK